MDEKELLQALDKGFRDQTEALRKEIVSLKPSEPSTDSVKLAEESKTKLKETEDKVKGLESQVAQLQASLAEASKVVNLAEATAEERQAFFLEVVPDAEAYVKLGESMGYLEKQEAEAAPHDGDKPEEKAEESKEPGESTAKVPLAEEKKPEPFVFKNIRKTELRNLGIEV